MRNIRQIAKRVISSRLTAVLDPVVVKLRDAVAGYEDIRDRFLDDGGLTVERMEEILNLLGYAVIETRNAIWDLDDGEMFTTRAATCVVAREVE